jgi:hypothetical protein
MAVWHHPSVIRITRSKTLKKAAIYTRSNTGDRDRQREELLAKFGDTHEIVAEYQDEASGNQGVEDRPGLKKLLEDAGQGKFDVLRLASSGFVKIIHGANDGLFNVGGASVASVRASLVDAFNIPDEAVSFANGDQVEGEFRLQMNSTLEFVMKWGRKGSRDERDEYFVRTSDIQLKLNEILFRLRRLEDVILQVVKQQAPSKEFYAVEEFAKLVDLSSYTVREHCRLRRLRAEKAACGRGNIPEWRIPHAELVRYRSHGLLPIAKHGG